MIGFVQLGTSRGIRGITIGSRNRVPPLHLGQRADGAAGMRTVARAYRMFLIVPLGDSHTSSVSRKPKAAVIGDGTLLQVKLLDARLVRGDGSAFHTNAVFLDGLCCFDRNLILGLITVFQALGTMISNSPFCASMREIHYHRNPTKS